MADKCPEIAAEWHPTANGDLKPHQVSASSALKAMWLCPEGHEYPALVRNRVYAKSKCPVCRGRRVVPGVNDIATTHPELAAQWHEDNTVEPTEVSYKSETIIIKWRCPVEGYVWDASPASRAYYGTSGKCPVCRGQEIMIGVNDIFTVVPEWRRQWHPDNTVDPLTITAKSGVPVRWKCPVDGHEWELPPAQRWTGRTPNGCRVCSGNVRFVGVNDLATTHPALAAELSDPTLATELGAGSGEVEWVCAAGHTWTAAVSDRTSKGYGCTRCTGKVVTPGVNDLATLRPDLAAEWHPDNSKRPSDVSLGSNYRAQWVCASDSSHVWGTAVNNRVSAASGCPHCSSALRVSKGENDLAEFVSTLVGSENVERNVRNVIDGSKAELDIYIPSMSIAVEYHGVYYHSSAFHSDPKRHYKKLEDCTSSGIRLIQVWEDDWNLRRRVVKEMLAVKLGKRRAETVYARNTSAHTATSHSVSEFLERNHIQGAIPGTWNVALRDGAGEVVAVIVSRRLSPSTAEISRYATSKGVVGGFSKALAALENVLPTEVSSLVTFADREISDGKLYHDNGFVVDAVIPPDYKYLVPSKCVREHKFNFRKPRFKSDPSLQYVDGMTERELADLNGLYRCYDSGKLRFVKAVARR